MTVTPALAKPNPAAVLDALGWKGSGAIVPITGGWDTHLWRFTAGDGRDCALRLYRSDPEPESLTVRARGERAALRAAGAAGLPVPPIFAEGVFEGVPVFVQGWMPGNQLLHRIERTPWRLWPLGLAFGRMQARLHRLPIPAEVPALGEAQLLRWAPVPALVAAVAKVSRNDAFCHLDYHPLNVLAEGTRITALLDFTNCAIGDRRFDLGTTHALLTSAPLPPGPARTVMAQGRRLFVAAWRRGYRAEAGDFPSTPLFEALGLARACGSIESAASEGRGWATPGDAIAVRAKLIRKLRALGIDPTAA
ncbi:MAG: phosphotransferase [Chloroflexi bacterium]|nr:phosphotransferase [Chloroflexota bacterium]